MKNLNRTIFIRNNLEVLRCLPDNYVDLIYLDPPFNSNKNYSAPIGSEAAGAHFKDIWTYSDTDDAWWGELSDKNPKLYEIIHAIGCVNGESHKSYLIAMSMRLIELHRVLKETGSIYLHCDKTMNHCLKLILDAIFNKQNFKNEIIWQYPQGIKSSDKKFLSNNDIILFYSKTESYQFNKQTNPYTSKQLERFKHKDDKGLYYFDTRRDKYNNKKRVKVYQKKSGTPVGSVWYFNRAQGKEKTDYPTQKPVTLLERIIQASSNEGDLILDPFCGCATTCIAAEKLNRRWIGIDCEKKAGELVYTRLEKELFTQMKLGVGRINPTIRETLPIKNASKPSDDIKYTLYGKQKGHCNGCKVHFLFRNFHKDHIIPTSKGGQDTNANLQLLCGYCNSVKKDRPMAYLLAHLKRHKSNKQIYPF